MQAGSMILNIDFARVLLYNVFSKILLSAKINPYDLYKEVLCLTLTKAYSPISSPMECI